MACFPSGQPCISPRFFAARLSPNGEPKAWKPTDGDTVFVGRMSTRTKKPATHISPENNSSNRSPRPRRYARPGKFSLFFDRRRCILKIIRIENKVGDQRSPSPGKGARRLYRDIGPDPGGHGSGFDNFGGVSVAGDLHCHTKISDGSMGIDELIAFAKRRGLSAISITDHDTTASAIRAVVIGRRQQINVIHGVELSTWDTPRTGRRICSVISAIFPIGWRPVPAVSARTAKGLHDHDTQGDAVLSYPVGNDRQMRHGQHQYFQAAHHARPDGRRLRGHHLRRAV